jgi:CheY-like chemotaxis protein
MDWAGRGERTAIVVDDDVFVLSALAELLSEDGYDVHTASNGFSALRQVSELHPTVVVLDLVLPERSGAEVLAELRGDPAMRDVAVVVVTGHPEQVTETLTGQADGVISKPFDVYELMSTVHRAVQRALARRSEVAPVANIHRTAPAGTRRASGAGRTRGRR